MPQGKRGYDELDPDHGAGIFLALGVISTSRQFIDPKEFLSGLADPVLAVTVPLVFGLHPACCESPVFRR
jgi:hypothetical protein